MKTLFACVALAALAACAKPAPKWEKAGASELVVEEAMQSCRLRQELAPQPRSNAPLAPGGTPVIDRIASRDAHDAERLRKCMEEKGFSAKP